MGCSRAVICDAGVMATPFGPTADGFETQCGTDHLGHFTLVNRLKPLLRTGSLVVMLTSGGHRAGDVDLEDPSLPRTPYNEWTAYDWSKTVNILFTGEFNRYHRGNGVCTAAVYPASSRTKSAAATAKTAMS